MVYQLLACDRETKTINIGNRLRYTIKIDFSIARDLKLSRNDNVYYRVFDRR